MGTSLGLALRERSLANRVEGFDRDSEHLQKAVAAGAIERAGLTIAEAVAGSDLVVLAVPPGAIPAVLIEIAPHIEPEAIITDMGSVKQKIVETGERLFGQRFVGSHPMAGDVKSGPEAARADMFEDAPWAIVRSNPFDLKEDAPAKRIYSLTLALGASPLLMDAARHDKLAALVSHLPHLIAFAYSDTVESDPEMNLALKLAGASYRDITRISSSDGNLWQDIFQQNKDALLETLLCFEEKLQLLRKRLEQ